MQFQPTVSYPWPSPPPLPSSLSFHSQNLFLSYACPRVAVRAIAGRGMPVVCSISQVHSYGTMDFERRPPLKWSSLYRRISLMEDPSRGSAAILDRWEVEGRKLTKWDLCRVVKELRKFRRYKFALEVYEWMVEKEERFQLNTSDIAIQLDLIYKVHGISSAEDYFSKLPDSLKDMRTYGSLLNAYVRANMREKAEATLETMREAGYTLQTLPYNVMMTLYMNLEEYDQALSMISDMEKNSTPLDVYSFNIWITICGKMGNIEGMEKVLERMKLDPSINPNWTTYSTLASMYIKQGLLEKAETCLKDVELRVTGRDRIPFHYLISLYSSLGKKEEVYRIWNYYKSLFPSIPNQGYRSMISSLGRLGDIEGAETIYEEWASIKTSYDPRISNVLIGWYVKEGFIEKAEAFLDKVREGGCMPNANTWEVLAEGNMRRRNVDKALSCMKEAASIKSHWRPKPANVAVMLDLCKAEGDLTSAESFVELLRGIRCLNFHEYKSVVREHYGSDIHIDEMDLPEEGDEPDDYSEGETEMLTDQQHQF